MRLGEIIKDYRTRNHMNLLDFQEKSGISRAYVSILERGTDPRSGKKIMPSITIIKKAATAMGIGFDELFSMMDEEISLREDDEPMDVETFTVINGMKNFTPDQKRLVADYVEFLIRSQQLRDAAQNQETP